MAISQSCYQLRTVLFCAILLIWFIACEGYENHDLPALPSGVEAVSLLGDTLRTPELPDGLRDEYEANLESALSDYRTDPENADAIIWLGRRLAYSGNYRDAVRTFTEGIYKHPEDPRFYRHRGHRYITLRIFDNAITDLESAANLIRGQPDSVEPDGLPNELNEPGSTLHTNIWYHLGLARYLAGDFTAAAESFGFCLEASPNDDMRVAAVYWYYMAERRAGEDEKAGRLLQDVELEMNVIENDAYHQLLLVFKGIFDADKLIEAADDALQNATVGYGIGNWHYINGRTDRAIQIWEEVLQTGNWPAFGYIAAEVELAGR